MSFDKQVRCPSCECKFPARTNYVDKVNEEKSSHQVSVEKFMELGGQERPSKPTIPSLEIRNLRAKLILEEALETVKALGFNAIVYNNKLDTLYNDYEPNLKEIADGCCDLLVVTTGTLSACGVNDIRPVEIVDENNLDKFIWTHAQRTELLKDHNDYVINYKYPLDITGDKYACVVTNKEGKIIKPLDHKKPNLEVELKRQSNL